MGAARTVSDAERRARLARRHALAPSHRAATVEEAAARVVCLHATDPSTVFLSAWARVDGMAVSDMERALYEQRTLVKQLAMRRTLFAFPREVLDHAIAGPAARVAAAERKRLIKEVEAAGLHEDGAAWLAAVTDEVLDALAEGRQATSSELRAAIPLLEGTLTVGVGSTWGGEIPIGPRVLTVLAAEGLLVRACNDGAWTTSRPRWTSMAAWVRAAPVAMEAQTGTTELVGRWLRAFGPGTVQDMKWWLGGTVSAVKQALADLAAVEVALDDGGTAWLLPDDVEVEPEAEPWAGLLPSLDPTVMGWFARDWYLDPHREHVFDRNGNAGHTAWWDGRVVGGWRQTPDGAIELQLLDDVGAEAAARLEAEAERLARWLDGARALPRYPSPLSKRAA